MALNITRQCVRAWNKKGQQKGIIKKIRTFQVLCIIHARIMGIYLLGRCAPVEADESVEEVVACGIKVGASLVVREVVLERRAM